MSEILTQDLGMKHVTAKSVPQLLLPEQKEHRDAIANDLSQTTTNEPGFLKKVITRDKSWVPTLKETEVSMSYVQCFLYLVPSSVNVSVFHIAWLGIFWTDYTHTSYSLYIHTYTHTRNILPQKRRSCHFQQQGWYLRALCLVK